MDGKAAFGPAKISGQALGQALRHNRRSAFSHSPRFAGDLLFMNATLNASSLRQTLLKMYRSELSLHFLVLEPKRRIRTASGQLNQEERVHHWIVLLRISVPGQGFNLLRQLMRDRNWHSNLA